MRLVALAALPLLLSACGAPTGLVLTTYAIDGAAYVGTGKTISGHALSAATKKNCSVLYGLTRGQLCEDVPVEQAEVPSDTRVPDIAPPGKVTEPIIMGDAALAEIDDSFANLETTNASVEFPPAQTVREARMPPKKHTPMWTLVVGTFNNEAAAEKLVKRLRPEPAIVTVIVDQGEVAYRVTTSPFKISEADRRKEQVAHLELPDVHVVRVCPVWMQDGRCVVLDRAKFRQRAKLNK